MKIIRVFTDGSVKGKKNNKIGGYGIHFPDGELEDLGRKFTHKPITNQRAELYAIYKALKIIIINKIEFEKIIIYTDSEYSINSLTKWIDNWIKNGWVTYNGTDVLNKDIISKIYDKYIKNYNIEFIHVRSHTGKKDELSLGNEIADRLANQGAEQNL